MGGFGIPGIGGSLGCCAWCGENFTLNLFTGEHVHSIDVAGVTMALHKKCLLPMEAIATANDGRVPLACYGEFPDGSPLGKKMKQMHEERLKGKGGATVDAADLRSHASEGEPNDES